jgi:hypothetical protein
MSQFVIFLSLSKRALSNLSVFEQLNLPEACLCLFDVF